MDFDQILTLLITTVLVPLLTWGVATLIKLADAKIAQVKDKTLRDALVAAQKELSLAVMTAVTETQETFVKTIKAEGPFTTIDASMAFNKSFARTKEIMSNAGMEVIETATGALNATITAQIEAALKDVKIEWCVPLEVNTDAG